VYRQPVATRERIEKNERLFREVNERIREVGERFADGLTLFDFFCECADFECIERLTLTLRDYESVRAHPARFVVLPGHELPDAERVVDRKDGFVVVEKPSLLE
jgi:hypothetical protein